jgi:hypothetical protein
MSTSKNEIDEVQRTNWMGAIPVALSLSQLSLSSSTMPDPIHKLIARNSYLHVALEQEIRFLHKYAPFSNCTFRSVSQSDDADEDPLNNSSIADQEGHERLTNSNEALSSDRVQKETAGTTEEDDEITRKEAAFPTCWFEDEATGLPMRWQLFIGILYDMLRLKRFESGADFNKMIPWRIRLHFTSYPESILPLNTIGKDDVMHHVFQQYLNSLKQALYLQHQTNRIAKNLNKKAHMQIWDGIKNSLWEDCFREIASELNAGDDDNYAVVEQVPIRILVDDQPAFSRPCKKSKDDNSGPMTVENVLRDWLPNLFERKFRWCIQGIQVPMDYSVDELWKTLSHPDRFLYIQVVTETIDS